MKKSRRNFIKKAGVAAGITLTPFENIFAITNPAIEENPIVGHGDYTYRVDKKWGIQDPSQFPVNDCHEMVMDKNKRLLMTTTHPKNNILIYDRSGKILDAWGTEYPGAHCLTLVEEGESKKLGHKEEKQGEMRSKGGGRQAKNKSFRRQNITRVPTLMSPYFFKYT